MRQLSASQSAVPPSTGGGGLTVSASDWNVGDNTHRYTCDNRRQMEKRHFLALSSDAALQIMAFMYLSSSRYTNMLFVLTDTHPHVN
jgi:hypothetical protein